MIPVQSTQSTGTIQVVAYRSDDLKEWGDTEHFPGDDFTKIIDWADKRASWAKKFRAMADDWNFFEEGVVIMGQVRWNRIPMKDKTQFVN